MTFTARELARATGGRVMGRDARARGLSLDSRTLTAGQAFAAVVGSRADAHDFAPDAARAGAPLLLVQRPVEVGDEVAQVLVEDTERALAALGRHLREREDLTVVGVTGSAGKTTTKMLTAAALEARASPGNYNTVYGLALALANLDEDTERVVLEMGISRPGEMAVLADMVRPDLVVITNVSSAHIEFFDSLEDLAGEKASCLVGLRPGGGAVWNADDPLLDAAVRRRLPEGARTLRFGRSEGADLRLLSYRARNGSSEGQGLGGGRGRLALPDGSEREFSLPLPGHHNAFNALAALGAGLLLGRDPEAMIPRLAEVGPLEGRGRLRRIGPVTVLDESYNANPSAVAAALDVLAAASALRRVAVLGDMLELGAHSSEAHAEVGRKVAAAGVDLFLGVGSAMAEAVRTARQEGVEAVACEDAEEAGRHLVDRVAEGDLILVKGSRSMATEGAIHALEQAFGPAEKGGE